jgi:hypothetical protein
MTFFWFAALDALGLAICFFGMYRSNLVYAYRIRQLKKCRTMADLIELSKGPSYEKMLFDLRNWPASRLWKDQT